MSTVALVVGASSVRLWNLDSEQRIARQIDQIGSIPRLATLRDAPQAVHVLLLSAQYLFEVRTLTSLLQRGHGVLCAADDPRPAAALVARDEAEAVQAAMAEGKPLPDGIPRLGIADLDVFDNQLRRAKPPLLEAISPTRVAALEALLYGTSYKGITDLVTKFVWPRPARSGVRFCARFSITPNAVTTLGFLLMLLACFLFANGQFALGLVAGWFMTYLDTVDGKLARVTVRSSRIGHLFDHGMDLIHPPFWYVLWGGALVDWAAADTLGASLTPVWGFTLSGLNWLIVVGYIGGRLVEALFGLLGNCSIFSWRPFDAYFRLVTARRNTCLILLTLGVLIGRPDWAFLAVVVWTVGTTAVLVLRLLQGVMVRMRSGPLTSWLSDPESAARLYPRAHRVFSATRSAYALSTPGS